jgi:acyl-coenzyme A synthetase/AMP-(fatty) acid ligase
MDHVTCNWRTIRYREIHIVSELPKGRSGKVLVKDLAARLQDFAIQKNENNLEKLEQQVIELASESFRVPVNELSLTTAPANISKWDSVAHMDL